MKIERLVAILLVLLNKEKVTTEYLAEKFEVSKRTILRDLESLNQAGIPIIAMRGNGGGVSVMENYKLDKTLLTNDDLRSIIAGLKGLDSVSSTGRYKQLIEKLNASDVGNPIIIDLSSWDKSHLSEKIALIKSAVIKNETISFRYVSVNGESERTIEPYYILFQWSNWYVWGYCLLREKYRLFKLSRISDLRLNGITCEDRGVPLYTPDKLLHTKYEIEVTVRFDKSVKWRVVDEFGIEFLEYDSKGDIVITFTWSDVTALFRYILSFADKAEIIAPEEYRKDFIALLNNIRTNYQI